MQTKDVIEQLYRAFNARNIDQALALMAEDVVWPKASEGGTIQGKEEIRAYWTRQWAEFDPHVEPRAIRESGSAQVDVDVHQVVKTTGGEPLFDGLVLHRYTLKDGQVQAMEVVDAPADAFRRSV